VTPTFTRKAALARAVMALIVMALMVLWIMAADQAKQAETVRVDVESDYETKAEQCIYNGGGEDACVLAEMKRSMGMK
jgi:hypothetical protein